MSIRWNSPEFWAAYRGDFAAITNIGDPVGFRRGRHRPDLGEKCWFGWLSLYLFDITDAPPADQWRESLIERPYEWHEPDESTPIDAKVWFSLGRMHVFSRGYYAGHGRVWGGGRASWTKLIVDGTIAGGVILLADPQNPDRVPSSDWKPKGKTP